MKEDEINELRKEWKELKARLVRIEATLLKEFSQLGIHEKVYGFIHKNQKHKCSPNRVGRALGRLVALKGKSFDEIANMSENNLLVEPGVGRKAVLCIKDFLRFKGHIGSLNIDD